MFSLALKFRGLHSNRRKEDIMKRNIKKKTNSKTNLWVHVSSVWFSINWKALMEMYDSMLKRVEAAIKAKARSTQY